jgi:hypothetical protein
MTAYDYLHIASRIAGPGYEPLILAVAKNLHYNESLHLHDLGGEKKNHGACSYCLMRAGQAVRAMSDLGALGPREVTL